MANTIATFCDHYGNQYIYAEGSTPSRTWLYQMGMAGLWNEISTDFEVYGLKDADWQPSKPYGVNYEALWLKK